MNAIAQLARSTYWAILICIGVCYPATLTAQYSTSVNISNGKTTIKVNNGLNKYVIESKGTFVLSDDDKDILSVSSGGYLELSKTAFGSRRRMVIEPNGSGGVEKTYYEGSRKVSFIPDGKAWLAEVLPEIVRSTVLGAESRVNRFYRNGGTPAVLAEVRQLDSDYVATKYIELLMEKGLSVAELTQIVKVAGESIESDHHLAEILRHNREALTQSPGAISAYIVATKNIESDHHKSQVLRGIIKDDQISDAQLGELLAITEGIDSDHHLAEVYKSIINERELSDQNINTLIKLSESIDSDHHKAETFKRLINDRDLSSANLALFLEQLEDINSDHHMTSVLMEVVEKDINEKNQILLLDLIDDEISSDHHARAVLIDFAEEQEMSDEVYGVYLNTVESISSDHFSAEVLKNLVEEEKLNENRMLELLDAMESISSDHFLTEAMMAIANDVRNSGSTVKNAYRKVAKSISSEMFYGRVIRAID